MSYPSSNSTSKCEEARAIDLAWLRRQGHVVPGSNAILKWSGGAEKAAVLRYRVEEKTMRCAAGS
jgi:hypothetical protein